MVLHATGTIDGRRHDWTLYCRSGIEESVSQMTPVYGKQYYIYGDFGYKERSFFEFSYKGSNLTAHQRGINCNMFKGQVTLERYFNGIKLYWVTMDYKRKMYMGESPVGALYIVTILLTNLRNWVYPNSFSQYFNCPPPTSEEYLEHKQQINVLLLL